MALKRALFKIKGMTRDLAVSKFSPEFAYENKNLRILASEDNTSGALVTEKGNTLASTVPGIPIGETVIDDELIVFSASNSDPSYRQGARAIAVTCTSIPKLYYSSVDAKNDINGTEMPFWGSGSTYDFYKGQGGMIIALTDIQGNRRIFTGGGCPLYKKEAGSNAATVYFVNNYLTPLTPSDNYPSSEQQETFAEVFYEDTDSISKYYYDANGDIVHETLYEGPLNFDSTKPIECISLYEGKGLKKVYWTDGHNQPRVINVAASAAIIASWANRDYPFDFVRKIKLKEEVEITRALVSSGSFAPGTVQYYLAYYNLYGQQSNIFYTSPLYYVSYNDRGAAENDTVGINFTIKIDTETIDQSYDYIRIYCLHRTSINSTPYARKVADIDITNVVPSTGVYVSYVDNGVVGETIDPSELFYIGGQATVFGTMAQKDNILFLGDIKSIKPKVTEEIKADLVSGATVDDFHDRKRIGETPSNYYTFRNHLIDNASKITTFKRGETYRIGVQLQDAYGTWSDAIFIKDYTVQNAPSQTYNGSVYGYYTTVKIRIVLTAAIENELLAAGFVRVRPVVVYPSISDRTVLCQGVLCPTVYNAKDRFNDFPFAMSSWFFRPNAPYDTKYDYGLKRYESEGAVYTYDATKTPVMSNFRQKESNINWVNRDVPEKGKWAEFRHNVPIPGNAQENSEIQCISHPPMPFLGYDTNYGGDKTYTEKDLPEEWVSQNKECFYVDQSILTFHSPDIEFDKEIRSIDSSNLRLRIVGYVPITSQVSDIDIIASTPPLNYSKSSSSTYPEVAPGFYKTRVGFRYETSGGYGWKSMLSGAFWLDELYGSSADNTGRNPVGFIVYPWHRSGSLNNTRGVAEGEVRPAVLSKKKMSILRHSEDTKFFASYWESYEENSATKTGISNVSIFDGTESSVIKVKHPENSFIGDFNYSGNIDEVLTFHTEEKNRYLDSDLDKAASVTHTASYYPIIAAMARADGTLTASSTAAAESDNFRTDNTWFQFGNQYTPLKDFYDNGGLSKHFYVTENVDSSGADGVSMRFKSSPHAVVTMNYTTDGRQVILPTHNNVNIVGTNSGTIGGNCPSTYSDALFWDPKYDSPQDKIQGVYQDSITLSSAPVTGYLWLGELYNGDPNLDNTRFGGQSEEAFENNQWLPAGDAVSLTGNIQPIIASNGDTYYQRYDCLKTYPFTMEDQNSVVDILSFMCETHVNIDGRYDRNRGQNSNLYMSPSNFNLLNTAYSQKNNFFNYKGINFKKLDTDTFPNTITWTKTKTFGEEIDTWTNITLASTLDLNGDLGKVRALRKFSDALLSFQDNGISQILYNENVQIATTTGVPIELANSGKVSGKRVLSNHIGCTNKWSICSTPNGLYFLDTNGKDLYLFNGEFNNLSDKFGFHSWVVNNLSSTNPWNPVDFDSCVLYYDKVEGDVFITTKDACLAFSEPLGQFSSFYDYNGAPFFVNIDNRGLMTRKSNNVISSPGYNLYSHHTGTPSRFFGDYKPYWTTVVVNPDITKDKVFSNLEYRADAFDIDGNYLRDYTFDTLEVWNEYQRGVATLSDTTNRPSNIKKKFRTWRALIPRNTTNTGGDLTHNYSRDRIRNPWIYLKLSKTPNSYRKHVLHDLAIDYFE